MLFSASNEKSQSDCMKALGLTDRHQDPAWPLPNMKTSDEKSFWGWRSSYSFNAEAWCGSKKVGDDWATILVYYLGHSDFIGGGFAVAVFRNYQKERVEYFTWKACDHSFSEKNVGNCLHRYTCSKCGESYEIDSSG